MPYVGRATECCYITSQSPGVCRTRALIYEKGPAFAAPTPRWSLLGKLDDFDDESNCRDRETNGGEDQHYYISCYINHRSEERRVGKACVRTCSSRCAPYH